MAQYRQPYVSGGGLLGFSWVNIATFFALFFFFGKLKDTVSSLFSSSDADAEAEKQTTVKIEQANSVAVDLANLPKTPSAYANFAEILYSAMDGLFTDKGKIRDLLNYTPNEFKAIYKAFGVRGNHTFGIKFKDMNLVEMLEYELNEIGDGALLQSLRERFGTTGLW